MSYKSQQVFRIMIIIHPGDLQGIITTDGYK